MLGLCVVSSVSPALINSSFGVGNIFLTMGALQIIPCVYLVIYMKETKGLNSDQKDKLYYSGKWRINMYWKNIIIILIE